MRAPQDLYSATVHNALSQQIETRVTYKISGVTQVESATLQPGQSHTFEQRTEQAGTMHITGVIERVDVSAEGGVTIDVEAPFPGITSPTRALKIAVETRDGKTVVYGGSYLWG
ncbi:hypothetical protein HDU87_008741 [Geranomyces variabilis]|uniref:Uncharacterized protein n=1 Tax=Geranomyces variabilis TaxID=109894 RepID=A0AAD5TDS6_9FUNG|nr:hypothetical protein HDU87_008741 [Geranomyces variabilis]